MTEPTGAADPAGQPPKEDPTGEPEPKNDPKSGEPTKEDPPKKSSEEFKSEESKKAVLADLAKEREARKALEDKFNALGEAFGVGKSDKGKTDLEELTERLSKHEEELQSERDARWRAEVAHEKNLTPKQAERLVGKTREELAADADSLLEVFPVAAKPGTPKPDPSQGGKGGSGPDIDSRIKEAQSKGDIKSVIALQNQKLADK